MKQVIFNPEKSFLHLSVVWFPISFLLCIAAVVSTVIIYNTPLAWDLSSNGFNYFIAIFRFPLGIVTLIIPIVALLATNHRSEQTKEQIRVTCVQNNFANYYKHLEEFVKYVDKQSMDDKFSGTRYIHKMLYPNAQFGNYDLCGDLSTTWRLVNELPRYMIDNYPSDHRDTILVDDLNVYIDIVEKLSSYLWEEKYNNRKKYEKGLLLRDRVISEETYANTYLSQSVLLMSDINNLANTLDKICHFSVEHTTRFNKELDKWFSKNNYLLGEPVDPDDFSSSGKTEHQTFERSNEKFKALLYNVTNLDVAA